MWCWRRKEKISRTDRVKNEVLHIVEEDRNVLHTLKTRKGSTVSCILSRNAF